MYRLVALFSYTNSHVLKVLLMVVLTVLREVAIVIWQLLPDTVVQYTFFFLVWDELGAHKGAMAYLHELCLKHWSASTGSCDVRFTYSPTNHSPASNGWDRCSNSIFSVGCSCPLLGVFLSILAHNNRTKRFQRYSSHSVKPAYDSDSR